jgi:hypothetical protein
MENPMRVLYTKAYLALYPKLAKDNAGVTAIEYGLIAALVAVVCSPRGVCSAIILAPPSTTLPTASERNKTPAVVR